MIEYNAEAPIIRLITSDRSTDVMKMLSVWALSNINSECQTQVTQASIDSGQLLPGLAWLFEEETHNPDILHKILWLLQNITVNHEENQLAVAACIAAPHQRSPEESEAYEYQDSSEGERGLLQLLALLVDFDEDKATQNKVPLDALAFSEKVVVEATKVFVNLFYQGEHMRINYHSNCFCPLC